MEMELVKEVEMANGSFTSQQKSHCVLSMAESQGPTAIQKTSSQNIKYLLHRSVQSMFDITVT